jgi:hypothetical protein
MPVNPHLAPQLDAYLSLSKPGFALMVDAPWGAGKTHSVGRWLVEKKHLFVSLYGATSREDIERAVIVARLDAMDNNASRALAAVVGAGVEVAASYFGLSNPKELKSIALTMLPDLIVFDDLERTEGIPVHSLLGVLNRYVEHEERHVILLANQTELRKGCEDYDRVREKVVGRVIALEPDETGALAAFLEQLKGRKSYTFLSAQQEVVLSVFKTSRCQNLRLLRQALLEYARFHDLVPDDLVDRIESMRHVLATFLALTIAFHQGKDFFLKDLDQDDSAMAASIVAKHEDKSLEAKGYHALTELFAKHEHVRLHQIALSGLLATSFIGKGHADSALVERELRNAKLFAEAEFDDWRTLWYWHVNDAADVENSLLSVRAKLTAKSVVDPSTVLHLAGIFLALSKRGMIPETGKQVVDLLTKYVRGLRADGILEPELPVGEWRDDFRHDSAYGLSFHEHTSAEFSEVKSMLFSELSGAFWEHSPEIADAILALAKDDPTQFRRILSERSSGQVPVSYAYVPVLATSDPQRAAQLFCALPPRQANNLLGLFKDRIATLERSHNAGWPDERTWLIKVRDEMGRIADATTEPVKKAQLLALTDWYLKFLDPEPEPEPEPVTGPTG